MPSATYESQLLSALAISSFILFPFSKPDDKEPLFSTHSPGWKSALSASRVSCGAPPRYKAVNEPPSQSAHPSVSRESSPHGSLVRLSASLCL